MIITGATQHLLTARHTSYAVLFYHVRDPSHSHVERELTRCYQHRSKHVYFSRDPLGRRSLLVHYPDANRPYFLLTSVSAGADPGHALEELSTESIYAIDMDRLAAIDVSLFVANDIATIT